MDNTNISEHAFASNGKANAALATGIIGTSLAGLLWGRGLLSTNGGASAAGGSNVAAGPGYCQTAEGKMAELESQISQLVAEKYADQVGIEVYKAGVQNYKELDDKINRNFEKAFDFIINLDKQSALNAQGLAYENKLTNARIDGAYNTVQMQLANAKQLTDLADASIISYVNSTFLPGTLKLPITSICPTPATATASTATSA